MDRAEADLMLKKQQSLRREPLFKRGISPHKKEVRIEFVLTGED
jgi:hypothetical protein